jgi:hypothetical protein
MMHAARRDGIVLPVMIGVLVLIELLALAILTAAFHEHIVAQQRVQSVRAQLAGRSAVARATATPYAGVQALPPAGRMLLFQRTDSLNTVTAELQRLTSGSFLIRAHAQSGPRERVARAAAAMLLTGFDPMQALAQVPGALNVGGSVWIDGTARVDGSSAALTGGGASPCPSWLVMPDSGAGIARAPGAQTDVHASALITGAPPIEDRHDLLASSIFDALGGFSLAQLAARADQHESGTLELSPVVSGATCVAGAPGNWGAPLQPGQPCADYFPLIHAASSLTLATGAGQGLLIVEGDLHLAAGTRFFGLALVTGRASVEAGAVLEGALLARAVVLAGGTVRRSNCALIRALTEPPALNRLEPRPTRRWIPVF